MPSMSFTRTSQKFGQWADSRANTVYGLGFATEQQLHQVSQKKRFKTLKMYLLVGAYNDVDAPKCSFYLKFSDKFREVKDAARLAREKSQDKELANSALTIAAPQVRF